MTTLDGTFAQLRAVADGWEQEAKRRRQLTNIDPAADVLEHCASELRDQVASIAADTYYLTPEDYARAHHVTAQTVRTWIKRGELAAVVTERGYRIRRDERRRKGA